MAKEKKTNAMRILERSKIVYKEYIYPCDDFIDGIDATKKIGKPLESSFKTLLTRGKSGSYVVLVIPVAEEVDFKKAAKAAGEKSLEMVHVKEIQALTGYIRGGVSPIGMKKSYPTLIHESAASYALIMVSGGRKGCSVELDPNALLQVTGGTFADIIA